MRQQKIIIDTDISFGLPFHDVDDALALVAAAFDENIEVIGVTTVFGNTSLLKSTEIARKLLHLLDADIPVYSGAAYPDNNLTDAARFIIKTALEYEDIVILGIGPHTNIATAMAWEPVVEDRRIVIMGGTLGKGNVPVSPYSEFNVFRDPLSTGLILARGHDVWMVGLDVTTKVRMTYNDICYLAENSKGKFGQWFIDGLNKWYNITRFIPAMRKGFPLHDPLALATITCPDSLQFAKISLSVNNRRINRGVLQISDGRPVNYAVNVDDKKFKSYLLNVLSKAIELSD